MAALVLPGKKSPRNANTAVDVDVDVERPKEKEATASLLSRGVKPFLLLIFIAVMGLKQDIAMTDEYDAVATLDALGSDTGPRVGAPNNNDSAVVGGNNNSSSQYEQAEYEYESPRLSLGSASGRANANVNANASNLFLLPSSEWLEDIDTESSVLGCGVFKCAFHSRISLRDSSSSNDPERIRYGYLVSDRIDIDIAERTFALAQKLSETFSIKHALLSNPITIGIVNANKNDHSFFVQPIELYPKDSILFKCVSDVFKNNLISVKSFQSSALVDPKVFEERLRSEFHKTMEMMMDSNHSQCLSQDFQLVIDAITGSIVHVDIDRCFQTINRGGWGEACIQKLQNITAGMIARKKYLYTIDGAGFNRQNYDKSTYKNKTVKMPKKGKNRKGHKKMTKTQRMTNRMIDMIDIARNRGN